MALVFDLGKGNEKILFSSALIYGGIDIYFLATVLLPELRVIKMDKKGCTVSWLWLKKIHKWEDLKIIRVDYWGSARTGYEGVVFSLKSEKWGRRIYQSKQIFESFNYINCFYVLFNSKEKKADSYAVDRNDFLAQLADWGVNFEVSKDYQMKVSYDKRVKNALEMRKERRKK